MEALELLIEHNRRLMDQNAQLMNLCVGLMTGHPLLPQSEPQEVKQEVDNSNLLPETVDQLDIEAIINRVQDSSLSGGELD